MWLILRLVNVSFTDVKEIAFSETGERDIFQDILSFLIWTCVLNM